MKWLVIALLALGLTGCGATPASVDPNVVALRTMEPPSQDRPLACMEALLEGTLVASGTSGIAVTDPDGGTHEITWPFGYWGRVDATGLHLIDETGAVVATVGDIVQIAGGETGNTWVTCGEITVVLPS